MPQPRPTPPPDDPAADRSAPGAAPQDPPARVPGHRLRPIAALDLARFRRPAIPGNRGLAWRGAWYLISAAMFQGAVTGLWPSPVKAAVLRAFGAQIGRGAVIKPRIRIKYPWFLELGDHVWLGEDVWIDNHTRVAIGSNSCLSQGVVVFTGNHDWADPAFAFFCEPVRIGAGVWVTAFTRLGPGTVIPPGMAVLG